MNAILRIAAWSSLCFFLPAFAAAAEPVSGAPPPPMTVVLQVAVDASGHVTSAESVDPQAMPGMVTAARAYAQKLVFSPARKDGLAVPSETNLSLVLALEPAGDGKFGLKLRRATNSPRVVSIGRMVAPDVPGRRSGATIVVSVNVDAKGMPDLASLKTESTRLPDASAFAEARYLDAIRKSVKGSRFAPDTVAGQPIPARLSLPFVFGRGGVAPQPGEDEEDRRGIPPALDPSQLPATSAVSSLPNVELPKIVYQAPAATGG